jgi:23S rRNA pseudouridine1911/1915/1917 synthase
MDIQQIKRLHFQVEPEANKQKLGEYLFENLNGLSKMYLRELIKTGKCEVNGEYENSGYRLRPKDFVEVEADLSRGTAMQPQDIPLDIVFEDEHLIVVNKPAGMLVHPTHRDRNDTLLNALTFHLNRGRYEFKTKIEEATSDSKYLSHSPTPPLPCSSTPSFIRPGLPHRLDKQTSGLIVVAKTPLAHRRLSEQFMQKVVVKRYLALVDGIVEKDEGSITARIGRYAEQKYWSVKSDGKHSESKYLVRKRFSNNTLLELEPVTGRTNQLRIHCESIGHPILGDVERGGREFHRLCLHAFRLSFRHPVRSEMLDLVNGQCDASIFT